VSQASGKNVHVKQRGASVILIVDSRVVVKLPAAGHVDEGQFGVRQEVRLEELVVGNVRRRAGAQREQDDDQAQGEQHND